LKGAMATKDLTKRTLSIGHRMYLAGEIAKREAISRPVIENAYSAFVDQGYVSRNDGKLDLTESYASAEAVKTIETRISAFLWPTAPLDV
jgi:glycerol-3-phosphate O-acyltransferase